MSSSTTRRPGPPRPTLRHERALLRSHGVTHLACADEVGRGALSGPVSIGMVLITEATRSAPAGVRDSKLLSPAARARLAPLVRRWAVSHAVGHASPAEIDELGIIAAMRLAGRRAMDQLSVPPGLVLLDGNHDYLSQPPPPAQASLFGDDEPEEVGFDFPAVLTRIKADMTCAGVAAASILAKLERDAMMVELADEHPEYGWADNKGYSAADHLEALRVHGASEHHRRSWRLPGITTPATADVGAAAREASTRLGNTDLHQEDA